MRYFGYPIMLTVVGLSAAVVLGMIGFVGGAAGAAKAPGAVSIALNFNGPNAVLLCWSQPEEWQVTSWDLQVRHWNFGKVKDEEVRDVKTSLCGPGAFAAAHTFIDDNLYHVAVRACRDEICSAWVDASPPERYWFRIPCGDASGNECAFPDESQRASGQ